MNVTEWLLDSDPSIRWQVLRDIVRAPADEVAAERSKVATEGWGARLLALQDKGGQWGREGHTLDDRPETGLPAPETRKLLRELQDISLDDLGSYLGIEPETLAAWESGEPDPEDERSKKYESVIGRMWNIGTYNPAWTSTTHTLVLLHDMGLDPASEGAKRAIGLVRDNSKWDHDGQDYFDGEVEPCVNGKTVALGSFFGENVDGIVERLLGEQLEDGGWNCEAVNGSTRSSFHTTIQVLDGFAEYERANPGRDDVTTSRLRGEEYLLERKLFRRRSTGEAVDERWLEFSYPPRWHYDVLRGLDYFRKAASRPDERCAEAIELVERKRQPDGRWLLENTYPGKVHFEMEEGDGRPSRWNTLRALRVLDWFGR